jgi:Superinfection immunity protein
MTAPTIFALLGVLIVLYILPTIIGLSRDVEDLGLLITVNFIGGATLVAWPAAMLLAITLPSTRPTHPAWAPPPMYLPGHPPPPDAWIRAAIAESGRDPNLYWP